MKNLPRLRVNSTTPYLFRMGHFYEKGTGQPRYETPYADPSKGMRRATIADARKHGWLPSVTTVLDILDKPALNRWKVGQAVEATYGKHKAEGTSLTKFMNRCIWDADKVAREARERGSRVHDHIEKYLLGCTTGFSNDDYKIVQAVGNFTCQEAPQSNDWRIEEYFGDKRGFGGKVDFSAKPIPLVMDYKSKEFTSEDIEAGKIKGWPEQCRQLAAYANGLGIPKAKLINVFVSVTEPGLIVPYEWTPEQAKQGWKEFKAILNCYQTINRMR